MELSITQNTNTEGSEKKQLGAMGFDMQQADVPEETLVEMIKAGILYGHKKSRKNPKFSEYVFSTRNGIEILDIVKTVHAIDIVANYLKKNKAEKKKILIVGTQAASRNAVEKLSAALDNCPYVVNRWIGGIITNFGVVSKRIEHLKRQKKGLTDGSFEKYTKRERLLIEREVAKMEEMFKGLDELGGRPDVVMVIDGSIKGHATAIHEARIKKCAVVGIIDNDDNPNDFDYFIPANDHSRASIEWVINRIIEKIQ